MKGSATTLKSDFRMALYTRGASAAQLVKAVVDWNHIILMG